MKVRRILSALSCSILFYTVIAAQDNCYVRKSFAAQTETTLRLTNKFGNVNIITSKDDSISVCAAITIAQDNPELKLKNLKLVNVRIVKSADTINVSTLYDKKFFSEEARQGRKSFSVDYIVRMPASVNIYISNEFGDILTDELSGIYNIRISHGTVNSRKVNRGNLKPVNSIYVDHGSVLVDELNWMTLTLFNCPKVEIRKAQALSITSLISKINISEINSLVSSSKSDSYNIGSINNLFSESIYSEYEIGKQSGQLKSKLTYGSLEIGSLTKDFGTIDIASEQAQIVLKTAISSSYKTDIEVNDVTFDFPVSKYSKIIRTGSNNSTTLAGLVGTDINTKSIINIRADGGKVVIE